MVPQGSHKDEGLASIPCQCKMHEGLYIFIHVGLQRSHKYICIHIVHSDEENKYTPDTYKATKEEKEEAVSALAKYDLLTDYADRERFLKDFEENGSGGGKDSLKFASNFKKSLEVNDTTELLQVEGYYTPGEILSFNGSSLANFKNVQDALSDVDHLVKKNMQAHGWTEEDHPPEIDEVKPEYSRYFYVKGKGKETSWKQTQSKKLEGQANLKNLAQLQQGCKFMEGLGFPEDEKEAGATIENVKYSLLMKEIEQCRSEAKKLQSWHQPFTMLKAQMTHKASKDENYNAFKTEIHDLIKEQDDFLSELYVWMQECESLDKALVTACVC